MISARALINDRRRREAHLGDFFASRLLRLDRSYSSQPSIFGLFKSLQSRRAA